MGSTPGMDVALARRPAASNIALAAYRDAFGEPYVSARQVAASVVVGSRRRDAFRRWRRGYERLWRGQELPRPVKVDGLYSLRDPLPGALMTARHSDIVTRGGSRPKAGGVTAARDGSTARGRR